MKHMRRIAMLAGILAGVTILAAGGGYLWLRSSLPTVDGSESLAGLDGQVDIIRDSNAVPHIFAGSTHDAYFALGYAHAQDRLWQMEFMRRVGAGRLAEILGEKAVGADRYIRTMDIPRVAAAISVRMPAEGKAVLSAYAEGVNAWLTNRSGALPPEFVLLRFEPEPWRPVDSILWSRLMALRLGRNNRTELIRVQVADALAAHGLPAALLDELWPQPPANGPVTIPDAVKKAAALFDTVPGARGF
ncbi:MAG: penicillin acylase family protein, partial [Proteobacteria bacterium]|nr:penicillin acylase family protein [Pseudomonadota bacterium]